MSNRRRIKRTRQIHALPPDVSAIVDAVCAQDRRYFEQHPNITQYTRRAVPGEFLGEPLPAGTVIRVHQLRPGVRLRTALGHTERGGVPVVIDMT